MNFGGGSNASSRNSSNASANRRAYGSGTRNTSGNRLGPSPNTRPVPNYMKPRNPSNNRSNSTGNRNDKYLPSNYVPPHLRGSSSITRVSPNRQPGSNPRVSPNTRTGPTYNRVSPSTRVAPHQTRVSPNTRPGYGAAAQNKPSPGSRLYGHV